MRLTEVETQAIKDAVYKLDSVAKVFLFGSRAHEKKRGGDIDLLILSQNLSQRDILKIKTSLWDKLGEQKIDIVLAKDDSQPFTKIALKEGIEIC